MLKNLPRLPFLTHVRALLLLSVMTLFLLSSASAYDLGEDVPICWKTNMGTGIRTQLDTCPDGISIEFTKKLPERLYEGKKYECSFKLTVDPTKGYVVAKQANSAEVMVDVPHANIHSCLSKIGFCTPFVANTPGLATHTTALNGDFATGGVQTFTNDVSLTADGYTIIAHGRVFVDDGSIKYDLAAALRRTVLQPENMVSVTEEVKLGMMGMTVVSSLILLSLLVAVIVKRTNKVMRFSQVEFLVLMLICGIVSSIGSLTLGYFPLEDSICVIRPWVTTFPLVLLFSFLFAKTYRVLKIVRNSSLKKQYHKANVVYVHTTIIAGIYAAIIVVGQLTSPRTSQREYAPRDLINFQLVCRGSVDGIVDTISMIYIATLVTVGVIMTRKTSSMVVLFNESKYIAFALQNMAFLAIVIIPTASAINAQPGPVFILHGLGLNLAALLTCCSIIVPKLLLIKSGVNVTLKNDGANTTNTIGGGEARRMSKRHILSAEGATDAPPIKVRDGAVPSKVGSRLEIARSMIDQVLESVNGGLAVDNDLLQDCIAEVSRLNDTMDRIILCSSKVSDKNSTDTHSSTAMDDTIATNI